eukprot:4705-Heterococcus_DN1.PRE.2
MQSAHCKLEAAVASTACYRLLAYCCAAPCSASTAAKNKKLCSVITGEEWHLAARLCCSKYCTKHDARPSTSAVFNAARRSTAHAMQHAHSYTVPQHAKHCAA